MTSIRRTFVFAGIVALGLVMAGEAAAGQVSDQLRSRIDRVVSILEDPILKIRLEERRVALRGAATDIFDFTEINLAFVRPKKQTDRSQAYAQGHS